MANNHREDLTPGTQLAGYTIVGPCGRGGFASVYRARHDILGRQAAIKMLDSILVPHGSAIERFTREARALTQVRHANVVEVYDFGTSPAGRPYLVLEWVEGRTLTDEILRRGRISIAEVLALAGKIAAGLSAIHSAGFVHRDLKSSNIMVGADGRSLKILDLGIAKALEDQGPLTLPGQVVGTPACVAPEQILGKGVSPATDIYAFGIVLFEMLAGRLPFSAQDPSDVYALHIEAPRPRVEQWCRVPVAVGDVIARCMAIEGGDRYQTPSEVVSALREAQAEVADTTALSPGDTVADSYQIIKRIGQGGMGTVYLAQHVRLPKKFALKVLSTAVDADSSRRFRREAKLVSEVGHENIVKVVDYDNLEGRAPFIVMEFVEGQELSEAIALGPMPLDRVANICRQVGSALAAVHAHGIVHRDVKPSNVLLSKNELAGDIVEHVTLIDFGISKLEDTKSLETASRIMLGTPQYMAPEQARGDRSVDARADQFSLAALCYEMLTGSAAFSGRNLAEVVHRVCHDTPPPVCEKRPEIARAVAHAIERALSKNPDDRFDSIQAFVEAFSGRPLAALPRRHDQRSSVPAAKPGRITESLEDPALRDTSYLSERETVREGPAGAAPRHGTADASHSEAADSMAPWIAAVGVTAAALVIAAIWWPRGSDESPAQQPVKSAVAGTDARVAADAAAARDAATVQSPQFDAAPPTPATDSKPPERLAVKRATPEPPELRLAERALAAGDYPATLRLVQRAMETRRTSYGYALMVKAYCGQGKLGAVRDYFARVPRRFRASVATYCRDVHSVDVGD